jgi:hypothetical protein
MSVHCYACKHGKLGARSADVCRTCFDRKTGIATHFEPATKDTKPRTEAEVIVRNTVTCGL